MRCSFGDNTQTSTELVQRHYKKKGFDPTEVIRAGLKARAAAILPAGRTPWSVPLFATALYVGGAVLVAREWMNGRITYHRGRPVRHSACCPSSSSRGERVCASAPTFSGVRSRRCRACCLAPWRLSLRALYLWRWADSGDVPVSDGFVVGIVMLALSVLYAGVGALKSTQHRAALAFRKMLASGREFFIAELAKERPALRDEWFPWVLAFGLGKQMDDWSALRASTAIDDGFQRHEHILKLVQLQRGRLFIRYVDRFCRRPLWWRWWWRFVGGGGGWSGRTYRAAEFEQFERGIEQLEQQ